MVALVHHLSFLASCLITVTLSWYLRNLIMIVQGGPFGDCWPRSLWAHSMMSGLGNVSGPRTLGSQVWRNVLASPFAVLSGRPISLRFDLQLLFSRSSTFRVSSRAFFWRNVSLLTGEGMSSSTLLMRVSAVYSLSEKTAIASFISWLDVMTSCTWVEKFSL